MNRRALLLMPAVLAGCSILPQRRYQETRSWPIDVPPPNPAVAAPPGAPTLVVRTLSAAPGLNNRALETLEPDGSLHANPYEMWLAPPADAIVSTLRDYLAQTGLFAAVVAPGTRLLPTYALEGQINAFWADAASGRAVVRIAYVLIDLQNNNGVTLQANADAASPMQGRGAEAQQQAQRAALADAFGQITRQLAAAIRPPRRRR
jgi:cholesterol transport system auxiliary component